MPHTIDLFLSYARNDDEAFARRLYDGLIARGLNVWYDRESMPNRGLAFSENIKRAVHESKRLALIVGPAALTSDYVTKEWRTALSACIPIIPIMRLSDYSALPPELAIMDALDFRDDVKFDSWLDYLLRQIAEDAPPPGEVHGLRWFQLPRGYIMRGELWTALDQAVRGDAIGVGVATSREQITALQGLAGLGKTIIAAAYAESCAVRRTFDSGVFWLTAGGTGEALTLMTTLGVQLGDEREEYKNTEIAAERLSNLLRNRRALIVLDDVWQSQVVNAFRPVLDADCRLLFTTRDTRLVTLTQAQRVRVKTLSIDDGVRVIGRWLGRPAADDLTNNPHLESERAIIDLLKGHTLAVTLAAARIDEVGAGYAPTLLTEYQQARDTDHPFADLELAPDDKNWSVEISLRLSYDALTPDGQTCFRQLGVLAENTTFSPEVTAAVWAVDAPKPSLRELESAALVEPEPDGRYSQHSVLRSYAAALLRRENVHDSIWLRYAAYFTKQAEQFVDLPPQDWRDTIERDVLHILAVGDGLVERQEKSDFQEVALEFAHNTYKFVRHRMEHQRRTWLEMGLALSRAMGNMTRETLFINQLGLLWSNLGEKHKALNYYEQALPMCRALGDRAGEAIALANMGRVYQDLGELYKALEYYGQALPISRAVGDRASEAIIFTSMGLAHRKLGELHKALGYYEHALPISRAIGDRVSEATILNNIANAWTALDKIHEALEIHEQVLEIRRQMGDKSAEAVSLHSIGFAWSTLGEKHKALDYYEQALLISQTVGDRMGEATTLTNIGAIWSALGNPHKALDYYEQALLISRAVGDLMTEASILNNIGHVWNTLGERRKALEHIEQALPIRRAVGDRDGEALALFNMSFLVDDNVQAIEYVQRAHDLWVAIDSPYAHKRTAPRLRKLRGE